MRFNHRRAAQDEGELPPEKGGFLATPPTTPPDQKSSIYNRLDITKGELGGFLSTSTRGTPFNFGNPENISIAAIALANSTPTPPEGPISGRKYLGNKRSSGGGVVRETPPVDLTDVQDLPVDIVAGLRSLQGGIAPKITNPSVWAEVVTDAIGLATSGWAKKALDLGWTSLDLFGVGPRDSAEFAGLAVWIEGRRLLGINGFGAVAGTERGYAYLRRGEGRNGVHPSPVLLWNFGKDRSRHFRSPSPRALRPRGEDPISSDRMACQAMPRLCAEAQRTRSEIRSTACSQS